MELGDLQIYDIIIFAGIAVFLVFRLRNVLGKRTGFEKNKSQEGVPEGEKNKEKIQPLNTLELNDDIKELKKAYVHLKDFDHKEFIKGAKLAFEVIINYFNKGDKKNLKKLLTQDVYKIFEEEINQKNIDPNSQFFSLNIEKIENVVVESGVIKISIKFVSEQFKNNDEATTVKKEDIWTFEKSVNSKSPNWLLSST